MVYNANSTPTKKAQNKSPAKDFFFKLKSKEKLKGTKQVTTHNVPC